MKVLTILVGLLVCFTNTGRGFDFGEAADKISKVLHGAEEIKKMISKATGDKGSVAIQGRTLHYEVEGGFHKWKWKYKGKAWDNEAGISVKSKGWESAGGAREHVLEDLVAELKKLGLLTD